MINQKSVNYLLSYMGVHYKYHECNTAMSVIAY